jgi:hypothetical protein
VSRVFDRAANGEEAAAALVGRLPTREVLPQ